MGIELAILGASAIGGIASARGSNRATTAQVDAGNANIEFQQGIYDSQAAMFDPFYQSGTNALAAYNYEMGLGPNPGSGQQNLPERPSYQAFDYGSSSPQYQDFNYQSSPGYQFQLQQGQQALDGTAASQGGVFSGATQKAQMDYATGLASQDYNNQFQNHLSAFGADLQGFQTGYNNAFQNYQTTYGNQSNEYANYMNQLSGLAGAGQSAAGQTASAAGNLGMTTSQSLGNIGNAQAAGAVAMGNTVNNSLGNAMSSYGYLNTTNPGMFG